MTEHHLARHLLWLDKVKVLMVLLLFFQPVILDEIVNECRKLVEETLHEQRIGPELRVQDFDDYIHLINGDVRVYIFLLNTV